MIKPIRSRGEIKSSRRTTRAISKKKRGEKAKMKTSQSRRAELGKKYDEPIIQKSGADEQKRPLKSPPSTITTMLILFAMFHVGGAFLSAGQASLFHGENRVRNHVTKKVTEVIDLKTTGGFLADETLSPTFEIFRSIFHSLCLSLCLCSSFLYFYLSLSAS